MIATELIRDLVADHIMGWTVCEHKNERDGRWWVDKDTVHICEVESWDITSWQVAGQVISRMKELYGFEGNNGFLLMDDSNGWYCEFPKPRWEGFSAETGPLTVSLTALRACGIEVVER